MTSSDWTRRRFLRTGALGGGLLYLGCGGGSGGPDAGSSLGDAAVPDARPGPDALIPTCGLVTEPNIEGPFFTPSSPERNVLSPADMQGTRLSLTGRVYSADCTPLAGALLDFWLANDGGDYDNAGFDLRGHQYSDAAGDYWLDTIIPGHYLNGNTFRPAHIHVKAGAPGFPVLTTQLYFEGDPYNDGDPFIRDSLIMPLADGKDGGKAAIFDFVLAPA
jgi:protocatechuate 3,4-dioxygenase beta subunit